MNVSSRLLGSLIPLTLVGAVVLSACAGGAAPAGTGSTNGGSGSSAGADSPKAQLDKLIAQAKQEGELDTATTTEQSSRVPQVKDAFAKMFGLNININVA